MSGAQLSFGRDTLVEGRTRVLANLDTGSHCPCCGQYAKAYRRRLNAGMVRTLQRIALRGAHALGGWVHYSNIDAAGEAREHSLLRFWGLLEPRSGTAGDWRVTPNGHAFLRGQLAVAEYAVIFNNQLQGLSAAQVTVHAVLGVAAQETAVAAVQEAS